LTNRHHLLHYGDTGAYWRFGRVEFTIQWKDNSAIGLRLHLANNISNKDSINTSQRQANARQSDQSMVVCFSIF